MPQRKAGGLSCPLQKAQGFARVSIFPFPSMNTISVASLQDVDCLHMTKEELEIRVALLRQQLEFLTCIFAEVWIASRSIDTHPKGVSLHCFSEHIQRARMIKPNESRSIFFIHFSKRSRKH